MWYIVVGFRHNPLREPPLVGSEKSFRLDFLLSFFFGVLRRTVTCSHGSVFCFTGARDGAAVSSAAAVASSATATSAGTCSACFGCCSGSAAAGAAGSSLLRLEAIDLLAAVGRLACDCGFAGGVHLILPRCADGCPSQNRGREKLHVIGSSVVSLAQHARCLACLVPVLFAPQALRRGTCGCIVARGTAADTLMYDPVVLVAGHVPVQHLYEVRDGPGHVHSDAPSSREEVDEVRNGLSLHAMNLAVLAQYPPQLVIWLLQRVLEDTHYFHLRPTILELDLLISHFNDGIS